MVAELELADITEFLEGKEVSASSFFAILFKLVANTLEQCL